MGAMNLAVSTTREPALPAGAPFAACVVVPWDGVGQEPTALVAAARALLPVFVVGDGVVGSAALAATGAEVLPQERRRSRGAALQAGFAAAAAAGYTHAITLEAVVDRVGAQILALLAAARQQPEALVVGVRQLDPHTKCRRARLQSTVLNCCGWLQTGQPQTDAPSHSRCYPLALVADLWLQRRHAEFELEVLTKCLWAGAPFCAVAVAVDAAAPRPRLHAIDALRLGTLVALQVVQRLCLPAPYLAVRCQRSYRQLPWRARLRRGLHECFVREAGAPGQLAAAVALGVFVGLSPIWGLQTVTALLLAHLFALPKAIAAAASGISIPVLIPGIVYGSLVLGRWLLGQRPADGGIGSLQLEHADFAAWVVGSFVLAAVVAGIAGSSVFVLARAQQRRRRGGTAAGRLVTDP